MLVAGKRYFRYGFQLPLSNFVAREYVTGFVNGKRIYLIYEWVDIITGNEAPALVPRMWKGWADAGNFIRVIAPDSPGVNAEQAIIEAINSGKFTTANNLDAVSLLNEFDRECRGQ